MEYPVGLRLRPTDEEIFDDYLRPKNLNSNTRDVDEVISTVTIRSFDPWELPSQSRIKLKDHVWYFFSRKENKYERGERQIRKTKSGYWKITGKPKDINRNGQKIGYKRVLVFHLSNVGSKSDWVMHEYHLLSPNQVMMTYTICKVMFKGDERDISSSSSSSSSAAGSEIVNTHSLIPLVNNSGGSEVVQSSIPHVLNNSGGSEVTQSLIPHDLNNSGALSTETEGSSFHSQELQNPLHSSGLLDAIIPTEEWRNYLVDDEQMNTMFLQDDRNDYRPQKSLTGVFADDSDSDLISATTNSIGASSTCDSFGSSNHRTHQITNLHESPNSTIKLLSLTQEVNQALRTSIDTSETKNPNDDAQGTEIGEHKMDQKTIKNKRAGFFYMIQKFVKKIQLCSSISRK